MSTAIDEARKRVVEALRSARASGSAIEVAQELDAALTALDALEAPDRARRLEALETPVVYEAVGYVSSYGRNSTPFVEIRGHDAARDSVCVTVVSGALLDAVAARGVAGDRGRYRITVAEIVEGADADSRPPATPMPGRGRSTS